MRKAVNTGIITGLILTVILILGTLCRLLLPADTTVANLTFTIIFISAITITLWIAMGRYSRSTIPSWGSLILVSTITSFTTAVLFSTASFLYTRFFDTHYLADLLARSKENWAERTYTSQSMALGDWNWYKAPWNFAFNNLQLMLIALFVISLCIAFVYYSRNRNKVPLHENHNNHELIF